MPSHSTHTHNSQETDKFQKMAKAAQDWIGTHDTPPFPDFLDPKIKALVVSDSHLVRGGLEYLGDRVLYPMVGAALMRTIPNRPHLFASMLSALTCNATLGEYMVAHRMHARTSNKGGGDTFETVFGALVKDRKRLGYGELQEFIHQFVAPIILTCVAAVECGKRKHEDDGVDLRSVAPISDLPRAKRQRPDAREEEMPAFIPSLHQAISFTPRPIPSYDLHTSDSSSSQLCELMNFLAIGSPSHPLTAKPPAASDTKTTRLPFSTLTNRI
ncbi:hypothetical protein DFH06DRAFT_1305510 [Mycena polygramma]|nr:hypothetical protein DFH06DRAFT_1305510 [Mycena polygramma]